MCSFIRLSVDLYPIYMIYMNKTLSGCLYYWSRGLKKKGKVQLGNPRSDRGRLWEWLRARFLLQSLSHSSNGLWGLTELVVTRVGRLREWPQLIRTASTVICKLDTLERIQEIEQLNKRKRNPDSKLTPA